MSRLGQQDVGHEGVAKSPLQSTFIHGILLK
ncbi:hypothetical protein LSPCS325_30980 [Lysinibacillus sp. CTST325]